MEIDACFDYFLNISFCNNGKKTLKLKLKKLQKNHLILITEHW